MSKHCILLKEDDSPIYIGIDHEDCKNRLRPTFIEHLEEGKPLNEFPMYIGELTDETISMWEERNSIIRGYIANNILENAMEQADNNTCKTCGCKSEFEYCSEQCYFDAHNESQLNALENQSVEC